MPKPFDDLRQFIGFLESQNDLVRVKQEVDPVLEVNAILDRLARTRGPAVLFENVKGSSMPLFGNAFGAWKRLSQAFGAEDFARLVEERGGGLLDLLAAPNQQVFLALRSHGLATKYKNFKSAMKGANWSQSLAGAKSALSMLPRAVSPSKVPCKEVILTGDEIDLNQFPLIQCWPKDGGRFMTLPLVITRDPENGVLNLGIYRMMQIDKNRLCMHWLPQKHGRRHYEKAEKMGKPLPVVVAVGADPALEVSGIFQLMPPADEFMVAGLLRGAPIQYTRAEDSDLWVPAGAEIVFEGEVRPGERHVEGPFGEFNGFYSPVKETPIFHVQKITMRRRPIWHAATTGMPPTEIHVFTKAMERLSVLVARQFFPGLKDINLTVESGTLYVLVAALEKTRPYEAQDLMYFLWSVATQSPFITNIIVVDQDVDPTDLAAVLSAVSHHARPDADVTITARGLADMEKPSTQPRGVGARMGIDATRKTPEEGREAEANEAQADPRALEAVQSRWKEFSGLTRVNAWADGPTLTILAALDKQKPYQARDAIGFFRDLVSEGDFALNIFVVDSDLDVNNLSDVFWALAMHMRPEHDALVVPDGPGRGMGLDATAKTPEEGLTRGTAELLSMDQEVLDKVDANWEKYGFKAGKEVV